MFPSPSVARAVAHWSATRMALDLWVLTHERLRGVARIRATMTALAAAIAARRNLLEGLAPNDGDA